MPGLLIFIFIFLDNTLEFLSVLLHEHSFAHSPQELESQSFDLNFTCPNHLSSAFDSCQEPHFDEPDTIQQHLQTISTRNSNANLSLIFEIAKLLEINLHQTRKKHEKKALSLRKAQFFLMKRDFSAKADQNFRVKKIFSLWKEPFAPKERIWLNHKACLSIGLKSIPSLKLKNFVRE